MGSALKMIEIHRSSVKKNDKKMRKERITNINTSIKYNISNGKLKSYKTNSLHLFGIIGTHTHTHL